MWLQKTSTRLEQIQYFMEQCMIRNVFSICIEPEKLSQSLETQIRWRVRFVVIKYKVYNNLFLYSLLSIIRYAVGWQRQYSVHQCFIIYASILVITRFMYLTFLCCGSCHILFLSVILLFPALNLATALLPVPLIMT